MVFPGGSLILTIQIPVSALKEFVCGLFKRIIVRNATDLLACSWPATEDLFGNEASQRATILNIGSGRALNFNKRIQMGSCQEKPKTVDCQVSQNGGRQR